MSGCIIIDKEDIQIVPASKGKSYQDEGTQYYKIILRVRNNITSEDIIPYREFESKNELTMERALEYRDNLLGLRSQ